MLTLLRPVRDLDEAVLAQTALTALGSSDAPAALAGEFEWMPNHLLREFIAEAIPLQNAGSGDLELVVRRFAHIVRSEFSDRRVLGVREWVSPLVFPAALAALLLTAVVLAR